MSEQQEAETAEDHKDMMSMFASVWVKVEVGEEPGISGYDPMDLTEYQPPKKKSYRRFTKTLKCDQCEYTTVYKNCLELHVLGHTDEKPHACTHCEYSTKFPTSLQRHLMIKHQVEGITVDGKHLEQLKCEDCDYTTNFKWNLNAHKRKHKSEKQFQCQHCEYKTAYRHNYLKHSKVHNKTNVMFKCDKCTFVTKYEGHITRHLAKIHNEVTEKANKCDLCDFSTKTKWRLTVHKQRSRQENGLKCVFCDFQTFYMCEMKKHKVIHYGDVYGNNKTNFNNVNSKDMEKDKEMPVNSLNNSNNEEENNEPTPEPESNISTEEIEESQSHSQNDSQSQYLLDPNCVDWNSIQVLESEDKERPFLCVMCSYTSKFKASVQRHFQRHHTGSHNRPYKCCNCDFSTKTKDQIALHNKRSLSDTPLFCSVCKFTTNYKCQFVTHQKCHYAYKCTSCPYTCKQKYDLQKHFMTIHLGNGLKCSYCDYKAARKESLLCHETIHTGIKPFKCEYCDYTSVRKGLLDNHMKRYHSNIKKDFTVVSESKIESLKIPIMNAMDEIRNEIEKCEKLQSVNKVAS